MAIDQEKIKTLREMTSAGILDCKKILEETNGDLEKAASLLRERGIVKAVKKMDREASEGAIVSYVHHNGKIGVLVQLNCETDFVARNEKFLELGRSIAMHIAATNPQFVKAEDVDPTVVEKEKEVQRAALIEEGKPADKVDKILEGKIKKFVSDICLLDQPFVKEPEKTVGDIIKASIATLGENIAVGRFVRYALK
ncbi:translation elongation factor Ts [Turneriella parva]|uniref:Elongation factor Ts n=1 Tax=Turneriella parva (strain ATCC BAA-1111 / DSM 21527 / NCTC 11395 / H) TaxID=869212 RepID=I4B1G3_TURPD|nr:translation elongation factor Ts [Turneriella parva]AFM11120.1 Elongation factor Ts [Turneriella parva DSM 21527]